MGSIKSSIALICISFVLFSCAASYKPIDPPSVNYRAYNDEEGLEFSYQYEVLAYRNNRRYEKKESKKGYNIIAVKLKNKTDRVLDFSRDIQISTMQGVPLMLADNETSAKNLRQGVFGYLLYGLLVYREVECVNNECEVKQTIPIGLGIAALNMLVAGGSNAKMRSEFVQYNIVNRAIKPGETVYGIICLRDIGFQPLTAKLK